MADFSVPMLEAMIERQKINKQIGFKSIIPLNTLMMDLLISQQQLDNTKVLQFAFKEVEKVMK